MSNLINSNNESVLKEICKILTNAEGIESKEKTDEVFSLLMGLKGIYQEVNAYFNNSESKTITLLTEWVNTRSVIEVIDLKHGLANWCFVIQALKVPNPIYATSSPKDMLQLIATTKGQTLGKTVVYSYGDIRTMKQSPEEASDPNALTNIVVVTVYKEATQLSKY